MQAYILKRRYITISKSYVSSLFICLKINGWNPPVKIDRGVPKILGSLRSPSRTPLTKTLKPPLARIRIQKRYINRYIQRSLHVIVHTSWGIHYTMILKKIWLVLKPNKHFFLDNANWIFNEIWTICTSTKDEEI